MEITKRAYTEIAASYQEQRIKELLDSASSTNTRRAYDTDLEQFSQFCIHSGLEEMPATPETIARYIAHIEISYKASTIQRKISAISKAHKQRGHTSPASHPIVKEVLKGLRVERSEQRQKQAPPLSTEQIERASHNLSILYTNKALRDRAALLLGFFGAFRRSELAALKWDDVKEDEKGLTIYIGKSKTDQEGKGQYKIFPYRSDPKACPVRALRAWHTCDQVTGRDYVFTSITKGDNVNDKPLSGKDIDRIIKKIFGKHSGYSAHSLRAGFVTEARRKGARIEAIKMQTGHKSDATVLRYSRSLDAWEDNAAILL